MKQTFYYRDSDLFQLRIGGRPAEVWREFWCGGVALATGQGTMELEIETAFDFEQAVVRPLRLGAEVRRTAPRRLRVRVTAPAYMSIEFDGRIDEVLLVLIDPPQVDETPGGDGELITFEPGVHEVGTLRLRSGQRLWIPRGAVLRGTLRAEGQKDITVAGGGILDGFAYERRPATEVNRSTRPLMVHLIDCENVRLEGFTVLNGPAWHVVPVGCRHIQISRLKVLNEAYNGDGIDIVGSRHVRISDCFVRTLDDCIAIKAKAVGSPSGEQDVHDVLAERLVCWNTRWGNAVEIGYETRCATMSRLVFRDIDIIRSGVTSPGSGGALTIHNGDRADVNDVLYEDIRVEDARNKLIDFKVTLDRYSVDEQRGQVRNVRVKNLQVVDGALPPSLVQGRHGHPVQDVQIEGLSYRGRPLRNPIEAHMIIEHSRNVRFA